jgi:serine protease inhibitor
MILPVVAFFAVQPSIQDVAKSQDPFGLAALKAVARPGTNTVVSPNSLLYALSGLYPGSSGESRKALGAALGVDEKTHIDLRPIFQTPAPRTEVLHSAAAAWVDEQIRPTQDYVDAIRGGLGYEIRNIDLQSPTAPTTINDWVKRATNDKIPSIVDKLPDAARLVLTSALYYNALWQHPMQVLDEPLLFGASMTKVKTMGTTANMRQFETDKFRAVFVPFRGDGIAEIYVPKGAETPESIAKTALEPCEPGPEVTTALRMPLWKTEFNGSARQMFQAAGLGPILEPRNEFRAIGEDLFVLDAFHRTWVDMNEKGVEAAAATAVIVGVTSAPVLTDPKPFDVDRPFFVVLRNRKSGAALFMGYIHEPTKA